MAGSTQWFLELREREKIFFFLVWVVWPILQRNTEDILHSYFLATHYDPQWYKAWHTWALANFEVIGELESQVEGRVNDIPGDGIAAHVVQAIEGFTLFSSYYCRSHVRLGFFRSIALTNVNALQDTLRLLTLWFKFGAHDVVSNAMANGFSSVDVDTWLEVIPQAGDAW